MTERSKSLLLLHTSVLLFGVTAIFSKVIPLSAAEINIFRSFIGAAAIAILLWVQKRPFKLHNRKDFYWMLILGSLLGFHWITYFHAMQVSTIAIGVISLYTFPLMTVFLEPLLTRQKLQLSDAITASIGLSGVFLMMPDSDQQNLGGHPIFHGVLWGLFSALLFAFRNIWQKQRLSHYPGDTTMLYQSLFAGCICLPFMTAAVLQISPLTWLHILLLSTLLTALPHSLFVGGLRRLKAKTASLISCMQPVYATSLAFLLLDEQPEIKTLLGGILVIGTAMLETWRSK